MNIFQLIQHGLIWGCVFSGVFCMATLIIGRINVEMLLNDYPPDIRQRFGSMSDQTRKQANLVSLPLLIALLGIVILTLRQLRVSDGELSFLNTFIVTVTMFQVWNLIDLVVLDWFILMRLRPRFMILPGTEGASGYQNYRFHFQKFLKGIPLTLVLGIFMTLFALGWEALV